MLAPVAAPDALGPAENDSRYFLGKFIFASQPTELEVLQDTLVEVNAEGLISSVSGDSSPDFNRKLEFAKSRHQLIQSRPGQFFMPGLVDLHIHAPQWPQLGNSLHLPLEQWLMNCTFPLEAKYRDPAFAAAVYPEMVEALIANGTTTAVYFSSIHKRATEILAEACVQQGQRAWVGKVAMDDEQQCPDYYRDESTLSGLYDTEALISIIRNMPGNELATVQPIITPRFIPSCTDAMLEGLGELAAAHDCLVQTHCSESDWEHQFVKDRLGKSDTQALLDFGLLRNGTVLAHSNFIDDADMGMIKHQHSGIAHCPLSNAYFADSVFPLRRALDKGLKVGLGTDISGGPSPSMLDSCRHVISSSRMLESGTDTNISRESRGVAGSRSDYIEAFYLATTGGGDVLDAKLGKFETGYHFDALLIDTNVSGSNIYSSSEFDSDADMFQKTLYGASRVNIGKVWVNGRLVHCLKA